SLYQLNKISAPKIDTELNGIKIKVSPDLVFRFKIDDKNYAGGIKFNIARKRNLTAKQRLLAANILFLNLSNHPKLRDSNVRPEFCVCLDVFQKNVSVSKLESESDTIPVLEELTKYISRFGRN